MPDPEVPNRLDEMDGFSSSEDARNCQPDSFIQKVADHRLAVEQDVPLDHLVEVRGHTSGGHGLCRWSLPGSADSAGVHYVLY